MRTPGRCTNTEGCWISASHRNVWLSVGEDFICPNCGGNLAPPLPQARSLRVVKRAASLGAVASLSLAVAGFAAMKLSAVSWPGRSVAARMVQAPVAPPGTAFQARIAGQRRLAEAPERMKPLTTSTEGMARAVVAAGPTSPFAMQGISAFGASQRAARARLASAQAPHAAGAVPAAVAAPSGPLMLFTADGERRAASGGSRPADDAAAAQQKAELATSQLRGALVTLVSQASLAPGLSMERPVVLPISFGRPIAPETDAEPVTPSWHHHGVVNIRRSVFLPAPRVSAPASADAIAQICRIPSLLH